MSNNGNGQSEALPGATQATLSIRGQYVKDLSFENPNAPLSLATTQEQPKIDVRVEVGARLLAETDFEVHIKIAASARHGEATAFVLELVYGGVFALANIPEDSRHAVCLIECPRLLFPFARRIVGDATRDGGFPPLLLDPIDFAALYRQQLTQQAEAAKDG